MLVFVGMGEKLSCELKAAGDGGVIIVEILGFISLPLILSVVVRRVVVVVTSD